MPVRAVAEVVLPENNGVRHACDVVGETSVALLAGCVPAVFTSAGAAATSRRLYHPAANGSDLEADPVAQPRTSPRRSPTAPAATRQPCATTPTGVVAWCMTSWETAPMCIPDAVRPTRRPTTTREASWEAWTRWLPALPNREFSVTSASGYFSRQDREAAASASPRARAGSGVG